MTLIKNFIGIIIGFILTITLCIVIPKPNPYFSVLVENKTSETITSIKLISDNKIYLIENLLVGEPKSIKVLAHGESLYSIVAFLKNGEILKGNDRYAERGYKMKETIKEKEILSNFQISY